MSQPTGLRVAFDARPLSTSVAGVATYCRELLSAMSTVAPDWSLLLLTKGPLRDPQPRGANIRVIARSGPLWLHTVMPAQAAAMRADVLHGMNHMVPLTHTRPTVVTIHDLTVLTLPQAHQRRNWLLTGSQMLLSLKRCEMIATVSECTKRDVMRTFRIAPERIMVTYPAPAPRYRPVQPTPDDIARLGGERPLPPHFILFLGALEPRKNVVTLVNAFADLCANPTFTHDLVIAGAAGWHNSDVAATIRARGLGARVHPLGYVPADLLPTLYNLADVFAFPSLYEGFGSPPMEALACGTPVVCSNAGSLPEVVGDAAITVPPRDVTALARALRQVIDDPNLRARMKRDSLARAAQFTWERTARDTISVYQEAIHRWRFAHNEGT